jgi:hypothetical protein
VKRTLVVLLVSLWCFGVIPQAQKPTARRLSDIREIGRFLGTYPCENGLLNSPSVTTALKTTLGSDYPAYRQHVASSGCGALEMRDGFVFADVSQLHVGGYTSFIFVHPIDGTTYVFWLKSAVWDKDWQLYGPRPVPESVLRTVETELNTGWGHVAQFRFDGQNLIILLNKH